MQKGSEKYLMKRSSLKRQPNDSTPRKVEKSFIADEFRWQIESNLDERSKLYFAGIESRLPTNFYKSPLEVFEKTNKPCLKTVRWVLEVGEQPQAAAELHLIGGPMTYAHLVWWGEISLDAWGILVSGIFLVYHPDIIRVLSAPGIHGLGTSSQVFSPSLAAGTLSSITLKDFTPGEWWATEVGCRSKLQLKALESWVKTDQRKALPRLEAKKGLLARLAGLLRWG